MKPFVWFTIVGVSLLLAGCASNSGTKAAPRPAAQTVSKPATPADAAPAKDKVLWQYRQALDSMRRGQFPEAKAELDDALTRIANLFGKDPSARQARGYFSPEAKKTFIGEPYERAMAYYYRGILYWMDGEPDNARACFRSAAVEDSDTKDKTYAADYVLFDYLDGFATAKLGGDGSDALKRAQTQARLSAPPEYNPKANVLFFVDYGPGPTKYAAGQYHEQLMFRPGVTPIRYVQVRIADKSLHLRPLDDLYFQATTRGGRVMDHILANKAGFKGATDTLGNAALLGGLIMAPNRGTREAGLGLAAFGLLSKLTSAATTPAADIRSWDNLPLYLSFAAVAVPPGQYTASIEFLDDAQRILPGYTKTLTFSVPEGSADKVIYVSDKSSTPQNL